MVRHALLCIHVPVYLPLVTMTNNYNELWQCDIRDKIYFKLILIIDPEIKSFAMILKSVLEVKTLLSIPTALFSFQYVYRECKTLRTYNNIIIKQNFAAYCRRVLISKAVDRGGNSD